jgi:hypothetical protein
MKISASPEEFLQLLNAAVLRVDPDVRVLYCLRYSDGNEPVGVYLPSFDPSDLPILMRVRKEMEATYNVPWSQS